MPLPLLSYLPPGRKAVGAKWVFKSKTDEMGIVTRAKARLVAKDFSQKPGIDYFETFAPTPASSAVRLLGAIANERDLEMMHLDAKVYVRLPLGCGALTNTIVRLNRAFYFCKQSSRAWNIHLTSTLKSFGFDQSKADPCLLRFLDGNETPLLIATHVDDMIAVGSRQNCDALCKHFRWNFPHTTWDSSVGILDVLLKETGRVEHLTFHRLLTLINCNSLGPCYGLRT
ncbi:unnamed protein product [Discosporangium mesarthrocarpum]